MPIGKVSDIGQKTAIRHFQTSMRCLAGNLGERGTQLGDRVIETMVEDISDRETGRVVGPSDLVG